MTQPPVDSFRWQALFQRAREPLFLLDGQRRILFVNRAWEDLTRLPAVQARGRRCRRRKLPETAPWEEVVPSLLAPPPEVREGRPGRVRRLVTDPSGLRRWWDMDYLPFKGEKGLLATLGRITPGPVTEAGAAPLKTSFLNLRETMSRVYSLDLLSDEVPALRRVLDQARLAAATRVPVLLLGEPGSGKRWLARAIHGLGAAREAPFVALDCERLPTLPLALALFRAGQPANLMSPGTRYLRQPAHLQRDVQERLVDLLRDADESGPRLVAGSTVDLAEEVRAGRLLEELHAALSTLVLHVPPLRDRQAELPTLVERYLDHLNAEREMRLTGLAPDAWDVLRAYPWPGNLRELFAVLRSAARVAASSRLTVQDLPAYLRIAARLGQTPDKQPEAGIPLTQLLEQAEKRLIELALRRTGGNVNRATELLSLPRARLLRRMRALHITPVKKGKKTPAEPGGAV